MNKIAIVTGGTRGIGLSITKGLIAEGYQVAALYHGNEDAAQKCATETGAKVFKTDVADFNACKEVIAKIEAEMGSVNVLVNNAGITKDGMLHKMPEENWHAVIETNLTSCFNMCHAVISGMRDRKFGRIINISSINGQKGQMGQCNYSAAKAGMLGFTRALAQESAAKGITVNAICPGYIATDMTSAMPQEVLDSIVRQIPAARMGKPEEIADMVVFLASDRSAFVNGATMTVNGGQYMAA
ncbi:MAG: acetoacetyl-CoA reductase [Alphaproteobacteria bacterium]|nr:acetoacetyl-CoA reductase [Alphaproteobacteria bacterium]MCB9984457.1 acetoacetyl-CoA reductase [Micavibrio sp.]MCB1551922.1 acetoacetyl-CoA reductase [Alphaproteobacteria bacterium]HPQ50950.1 acetoacetyl-CoA reductase [Alphaproteobacteria bacterium]HRK97777.1 acetoacetyl-CoA reductase [Alphaproteobacteria bacterium]